MRAEDETRICSLLVQVQELVSDKGGAGELLTFLCGAEEELRRVTIWMCHSHPVFSQMDHPVSVIYKAKTENVSNHVVVRPGASHHRLPAAPKEGEKSSIRTRFALAFEHNEFTVSDAQAEEGRLEINVSPPSAHERAEALLSLSEWLDGKVSEEEKRELLGLCD